MRDQAGGRESGSGTGGSGATALHRARRPVGAGGRARGPRPVRPGAVPVAVRPAQPRRPVCAGEPVRRGQRVVVRAVTPPHVFRRRRAVASVALALASAAAVVLLGLLADVAAAARHAPESVLPGHSLTSVSPPPGAGTGFLLR